MRCIDNTYSDIMESMNQDNIQTIEDFIQYFREDYADSGLIAEVINKGQIDKFQELAALDSELFGEYKSLTPNDFQRITETGGMIMAVREGGIGGALVAEATLILDAYAEAPSILERKLPPTMAYCNGVGVVERHRGKGLERSLLQFRELAALDAMKRVMSVSVRVQNIASIISLLREGYIITSYVDDYFYHDSTETGISRFVMTKIIGVYNELVDLNAIDDRFDYVSKGVTPLKALDEVLIQQSPMIVVAIDNDKRDSLSNSELAIGKILQQNYVGVACHDLDIADSDGQSSYGLVFVRLDTAATIEPFLSLGRLKPELDQLLGA